MQRKFIITIAALLLIAGVTIFELFIEEPNLNDPVLSALIEQLSDEGFEVLSVESTFLGRYKIEAHSDKFEREIVVAPGAGTFLRDEISLLEENDSDGDE